MKWDPDVQLYLFCELSLGRDQFASVNMDVPFILCFVIILLVIKISGTRSLFVTTATYVLIFLFHTSASAD